MRNVAIAVALACVLAAAVAYAIRFVAEYRKVKRELDGIRRSGRTKGAIRAMRRDLRRKQMKR